MAYPTIGDIARRLGELAKRDKEEAGKKRAFQEVRYLKALEAIWHQVLSSDLDAVDSAVKALRGIDAIIGLESLKGAVTLVDNRTQVPVQGEDWTEFLAARSVGNFYACTSSFASVGLRRVAKRLI